MKEFPIYYEECRLKWSFGVEDLIALHQKDFHTLIGSAVISTRKKLCKNVRYRLFTILTVYSLSAGASNDTRSVGPPVHCMRLDKD